MSTTTVMYVEIDPSSPNIGSGAADSARSTNHLDAVRRAVEAQHGHLGSVLGEGLVARFDSAYLAVRAARSIQQALELLGRAVGRTAPAARIGLAVGDVIEADPDGYGATIALARQLCDGAARPGDIAVSDLVRALLASRGDHELVPLAPVELAGLSAPLDAWLVPWTPLPGTARLRVVVADDATLIRAGIVHLLRDCGFDVIGEAADADELVSVVEAEPPDLVITDIRMPPTNTDDGLRAAAIIRRRHPHVAVLLLSQYVEPSRVADLLDHNSGGIGYLLKERVSDIDEFLDTCRSVAAGGSAIDPTVGERLISARRSTSQLTSLTPREREALALMAQGRSNQAIASDLFVSAKTVETYVRAIFQKLDLIETPDDNRRVRAVLHWLDGPPDSPER